MLPGTETQKKIPSTRWLTPPVHEEITMKLTLVVVFALGLVGTASAQTFPAGCTAGAAFSSTTGQACTLAVSAQTATDMTATTVTATDKKIAEIEAATKIAEAKLALVKAESALEAAKKILAAETTAEVERLRHIGEQSRQDNEVRRDNSRDDHRPLQVVVPSPYGGGLQGGQGVFAPIIGYRRR